VARASGRDFPATSWSLVRRLKEDQGTERQQHLARLIELYWEPVYWVIRHHWQRTDQDARDLTQEFFESAVLQGTLLENFAPNRGTFRGYVCGAISNFIIDQDRASQAQKRGGGIRLLSLEGAGLELANEPHLAERSTPEQVFDAAWTRIVFARATKLLAQRLEGEGKAVCLDVFRRYDLAEGTAPSYKTVGEALGLSVDQVKHALAQARDAFREVVTGIVSSYVDGPDELRLELRRLLGV